MDWYRLSSIIDSIDWIPRAYIRLAHKIIKPKTLREEKTDLWSRNDFGDWYATFFGEYRLLFFCRKSELFLLQRQWGPINGKGNCFRSYQYEVTKKRNNCISYSKLRYGYIVQMPCRSERNVNWARHRYVRDKLHDAHRMIKRGRRSVLQSRACTLLVYVQMFPENPVWKQIGRLSQSRSLGFLVWCGRTQPVFLTRHD